MTSVVTVMLFVSVSLLVMRHVLQLWLDLTRRKTIKVARGMTWAKGGYIVLMYTIILVGCLLSFLQGNREPTLHLVLGASLVWMGAILGIASIIQLGRSYSFDLSLCEGFQLITNGVYGIIQHPMRAGLAIEALGGVIASGLPALGVPWMTIVLLQVVRTRAEESMFSEHLGQDYEAYHRRVPRWNLLTGLLRWCARQRWMPSRRAVH